MKKIFCFFILPVLFASCITPRGYYDIGLQEVERPENIQERYGESKIVNFEEDGKSKYGYEDDLIEIVWMPLSTQIEFSLRNKTTHSIKIIWDEAAFVDGDGISGRIIHSGVKYTDRNNSQPPSVVVKNGRINDIIVPSENIYYTSGQYGGWNVHPLIPSYAQTKEEMQLLSQKYIGQEIQVLLPIQIDDTVNEYIFRFKINDFIAKS